MTHTVESHEAIIIGQALNRLAGSHIQEACTILEWAVEYQDTAEFGGRPVKDVMADMVANQRPYIVRVNDLVKRFTAQPMFDYVELYDKKTSEKIEELT